MQQILTIKQDQQQSDDERAGHIDEKSRERKAARILFIDGQRHQIAQQ